VTCDRSLTNFITEADLLFYSSDTMYRFEIIRSYYFIMWGIWHEIMNSSVQSDICFIMIIVAKFYGKQLFLGDSLVLWVRVLGQRVVVSKSCEYY
jgi:hypothetical protein